ncbi:hypothetical protein HZS_1021 [Henneguya salminicola]|nr:hypothetical protein HZS_1021 [Henneguya salminicola]
MEVGDCESSLPFIRVIDCDQKEGIYLFNSKAVEQILLTDAYRDQEVAVISVAGAFRKGKSFLLNFFIRYLQYVQKNGFTESNEWLGGAEEPLSGFPWRGGSERETDGILLWGEPFLIKLPTGKELVILLMDTQGAFDSNSTVKDCATVFAISTMISSVQIYNISGNLQEDFLAHLQLFTEYGRIALETSTAKPFQDLLFLIRDWSYPYEFEYGYAPAFLEKKLTILGNQPEELKCVRQHIKDCFEHVELFLLPHPGIKVAVTPNFNGNMKDIDPIFLEYLTTLVSSIISPEKLTPKLSQGTPIRCCDILTFFNSYIKVFQSNTLPAPKSMLRATAEANNLVALSSAKKLYMDNMNEICGGGKPYLPHDTFTLKHTAFYDEAVRQFTHCKKFGGDTIMHQYLERLEKELNERYQEFFAINKSKQVNSFKFIITSFLICIISFLTSQILDVVGLDVLMLPFNIISIIFLLLIIFCSYAQFYGGYSNVLYYLNLIPDMFIAYIKQHVISNYLETKKSQ